MIRAKKSKYKNVCYYTKSGTYYPRMTADSKVLQGHHYKDEYSAAIEAEHMRRSLGRTDDAFKHISSDEIDKLYADLRQKLGASKHEIKAKSVQGRRYRAKGSSKYIGVYKDKRGRRSPYCARIKKDGITHHLGCYTDEIDAARAYDQKAIEFYGDTAKLNFNRNN